MSKRILILMFTAILSLSIGTFGFGDQPVYKNAPKLSPNTTTEMQNPEFWISNIKGNPDKVILTLEQINKLNEKCKSLPENIKDINGKDYNIDEIIAHKDKIGLQYNVLNPLTLKSFPGDSLRARLRTNGELFVKGNYYDRRLMAYEKDQIDEMIAKMNEKAIPDKIIPEYGIFLAHTMAHVMPMTEAVFPNCGGWLDVFNTGAADLGSPAAILHKSKDGDWYFVRTDILFGWVPAKDVAIGSQADISKYVDSKDFIVPITHSVPIYGDNNFKSFTVDLYMGARAKLLEKTQAGYHLIIPVKKPDGTMGTADGWVKPDALVSVGYQKFTQRNILNTVFRLLYRPYGWADSFNERDCCGTMRAVYNTFGIVFGRWTSFQLHYSDHIYAFPKDTSKEIKYTYLDKCQPAITLVGDGGHIAMYIGKINGRHYVIHQSGYPYKGEDGSTMLYNRVNVNDTELDGGSNVLQWTEMTEFRP